MDIYHVKNAILFGFFLSFMIGPVFFMLIQTSILKGARAAIAFNLGVILGDVAFIVIAYFGSRHLLVRTVAHSQKSGWRRSTGSSLHLHKIL